MISYRIVLVMFFVVFVISPFHTYGKGNEIEQGIRYLKLGNSYREIGFYNEAKDYLQKGKKIVSQHKNTYWLAVSEEYFGLLESDQGDEKAAENHFIEAIKLYDKILPPSGSSLEATMHLLNPSQHFLSNSPRAKTKKYQGKIFELQESEEEIESPVETEEVLPVIPKEPSEFDDLLEIPSSPKPTLPQLQNTPNTTQKPNPSAPLTTPKESIGIDENEFDKLVEDIISGKPTTPKQSVVTPSRETEINNKLQNLERENKELKQQIELLRNELELMLNKKEPEQKKATKSKNARST